MAGGVHVMVYDARPGCCAMCGKAPSSDAESPGSQGARGIVGVGTPTGFRRCAGCRQQDYCSEACQRKHWPSHRQQCKESRGTGEARDAGHPRAMGSKLPALEPARRRQVVANCVIADKLLANLQKRGVQRHASAVDGASQEALLHEATRQWERGQLKSAEHSLRCLAETEPKNLDAKVVLARMVTSQGMLQEAEVLLQDVLGQDPSYLGALEQYGVFLGRYLKEYELAEKLLRLAATIMPSKRLQVLHLHAQGLAKIPGLRGITLGDAGPPETIPPPPPELGDGITEYGVFTRPPHPTKKILLSLNVTRGRNLVPMDLDGSSDPYVKLFFGDESFQTSIVKKDLNPNWNEEFELLLSAENMALPLVLQVWDHDYAASDDLMGEITVPLGDYIDPDAEVDHEAFSKWFALSAVNGDGDKQCVGEIELVFTFPKPAWARPHYVQNGDMIRDAYLETYAHIHRPNEPRVQKTSQTGSSDAGVKRRGEAGEQDDAGHVGGWAGVGDAGGIEHGAAGDHEQQADGQAALRGKRIGSKWPEHWYISGTVLCNPDPEHVLSRTGIAKLNDIFRKAEADFEAKASDSSRSSQI